MTLSNNFLLFPQTGDTMSIYLSSNEEWSITNKYDTSIWTITPTQGKAGVTEVFVSASKSKEQKKAVITFQAGKEQVKLYMAIDAPSTAKSEVITVTPSTYTFPATGGTLNVEVVCPDYDWSTDTGRYWVTLSPSIKTGSTTNITVTAVENSGETRSTGFLLTVNDPDESFGYLTLSQEAAAAAEFGVWPSSINFAAIGGSYPVRMSGVTQNWSAYTVGDGLTVSPTEGTYAMELTVNATANTGSTQRNGYVNVIHGSDFKTVFTTQAAGAPSGTFTISPGGGQYGYEGGSKTVAVTSTYPWTASSIYDYVTIFPTTGGGNANVTITVPENTTASARTFTVAFRNSVGGAITFSGDQEKVDFGISPVSLQFASTGGTGQIQLSGVTTDWSCTPESVGGWITASPLTGNTNGTINVTVAANTGTTMRNGYLNFAHGADSVTAFISQERGQSGGTISISPGAGTYSYTGDTKTLTLNSSHSWTASTTADYVSISPTTGTGNTTVGVSVPANTGDTERTFTVVFANEFGQSVTYGGTQPTAPVPISVTPYAGTYAYTGETKSVTARTDMSWTASTTADFITLSQYTGMGNATISITAAANPAAQRTFTITFTDAGGNTATYNGTQNSETSHLTISPSTAYIDSGASVVTFTLDCSYDIVKSSITTAATGSVIVNSITFNNDKTEMYVDVDGNNDASTRTSTITLTYTDGEGPNKTSTCHISQEAGRTSRIGITGPQSVAYNVTSASYTGTSNVSGTFNVTSSNPSWCSVANMTQDGTRVYFDLVFGTNQGVSNRTAVITVSQGSISTSFEFTQTYYVGDHALNFSPNNATVDNTAGSYTTPSYVANGITIGSIQLLDGGTGNMPVTAVTLSNYKLTFHYNAATSTTMQSYTKTIRGLGTDGNYYSASFTLYQQPYNYTPGPAVGGGTAPIWRDTMLSMQGDTYMDYKLLVDGSIVYAGRVYSIPNRNVDFKVNDIARDFLSHEISFTAGASYPSNYYKTFTVAIDGGNSYNYNFYNDWSYVNHSGVYISEPIAEDIPAGALVPFSYFAEGGGSASIYANGVSIASVTVSNSQTRFMTTAQEGVVYTSGPVKYKGVSPCRNNYVIYYINAYGGVDAFMPQHAKMRTDNITSYDMQQQYHTGTSEFAQKRYLVDVQPTWQFNTGWLTDEQSSRMHHLIESPMVYLYDMAKSVYIPVVMTENSLQYKTWFNQGKKKVSYTFTLKESQTKQRR